MHEDQDVAIDADPAGDMGSQFRLEFVAVEIALALYDDVALCVARAPHRLFDRARLVTRRDGERRKRVTRPFRGCLLRVGAMFALARRGDEDLHHRGARLDAIGLAETDRLRSGSDVERRATPEGQGERRRERPRPKHRRCAATSRAHIVLPSQRFVDWPGTASRRSRGGPNARSMWQM